MRRTSADGGGGVGNGGGRDGLHTPPPSEGIRGRFSGLASYLSPEGLRAAAQHTLARVANGVDSMVGASDAENDDRNRSNRAVRSCGAAVMLSDGAGESARSALGTRGPTGGRLRALAEMSVALRVSGRYDREESVSGAVRKTPPPPRARSASTDAAAQRRGAKRGRTAGKCAACAGGQQAPSVTCVRCGRGGCASCTVQAPALCHAPASHPSILRLVTVCQHCMRAVDFENRWHPHLMAKGGLEMDREGQDGTNEICACGAGALLLQVFGERKQHGGHVSALSSSQLQYNLNGLGLSPARAAQAGAASRGPPLPSRSHRVKRAQAHAHLVTLGIRAVILYQEAEEERAAEAVQAAQLEMEAAEARVIEAAMAAAAPPDEPVSTVSEEALTDVDQEPCPAAAATAAAAAAADDSAAAADNSAAATASPTRRAASSLAAARAYLGKGGRLRRGSSLHSVLARADRGGGSGSGRQPSRASLEEATAALSNARRSVERSMEMAAAAAAAAMQGATAEDATAAAMADRPSFATNGSEAADLSQFDRLTPFSALSRGRSMSALRSLRGSMGMRTPSSKALDSSGRRSGGGSARTSASGHRSRPASAGGSGGGGGGEGVGGVGGSGPVVGALDEADWRAAPDSPSGVSINPLMDVRGPLDESMSDGGDSAFEVDEDELEVAPSAMGRLQGAAGRASGADAAPSAKHKALAALMAAADDDDTAVGSPDSVPPQFAALTSSPLAADAAAAARKRPFAAEAPVAPAPASAGSAENGADDDAASDAGDGDGGGDGGDDAAAAAAAGAVAARRAAAAAATDALLAALFGSGAEAVKHARITGHARTVPLRLTVKKSLGRDASTLLEAARAGQLNWSSLRVQWGPSKGMGRGGRKVALADVTAVKTLTTARTSFSDDRLVMIVSPARILELEFKSTATRDAFVILLRRNLYL